MPTKTKAAAAMAASTKQTSDVSEASTSEHPTPKPIRVKRKGRSDDGLILVDREERAMVARFIRLNRSNYWLSSFIRVLLRIDADRPDMIPISEVESQLKSQKEVEDLVKKIQHIGHSGYWRDHPAISAVVEEWNDIYQYSSDASINKLIESSKAVKR